MYIKEKISKNFFLNSDLTVLHEVEKQRILRNNLILIFVLHLFPFVGILFSLCIYKWYELEVNKNHSLWFHLLFVIENPSQEKYFYSEFISRICRQYHELIESNGCSYYGIFELSGTISFIFFLMGLFVYFFFMMQLLMSIKNKGKFLSKLCFKQKTKQIFIFLMNSLGLFFWLTICTLTEFSLGKIGVSVYLMFFSTLFILPLVIYFIRLKKKIKTENTINNLLNADELWKDDFRMKQSSDL